MDEPAVQESIDRLLADVAALTRRIDERPRPAAQRYLPLCALAAVWMILIALVPIVRRDASPAGTAQTVAGHAGRPAPAGEYTAIAPAPELTGAPASAEVRASVPRPVASGASVALGAKTSLTRGGFECRAGVRQLPWSAYAPQCLTKFAGDNGAATYRGVTKDSILVANRIYPDSANQDAAMAILQQAGYADSSTTKEVMNVFLDYFNKTFELYGRRMVIQDVQGNPQSSNTEELQGRGKEAACVDATTIAEDVKAFAALSGIGSGPFSECAADRKLLVPIGAYGFPESWYRRYDPYVWGIQMECERISYHIAEYAGKRLVGRKARWAKDPAFQQRSRVFGGYVPLGDDYQFCVNLFEREFAKYGGKIASRYNYTVDVSRLPDEAARGVVQFKAAGVTTLVLAADFISVIFLTQNAKNQDWGPEWVIIGAGLHDIDNNARLYDQDMVDGHMFGPSQLGATGKLIGPQSEAAATYKRITGKDMPPGTDGNYILLMHLFSMFQAAGPRITPQAIATAVRSLPPGGAAGFAAGFWSYASDAIGDTRGDHTAVDDAREVYWRRDVTGYDGKSGAFVETYGGRRFRNGEWGSEDPPVYPGR